MVLIFLVQTTTTVSFLYLSGGPSLCALGCITHLTNCQMCYPLEWRYMQQLLCD